MTQSGQGRGLSQRRFEPLPCLVPSPGGAMRRRDKAGGKAIKTQRLKRLKRLNAPKAVPRRGSSTAGSETKVARLTRELHEALQQQAATSEVLRVISSSPGELKLVFDAMLAHAMRICEASFGNLLLYDGDGFHGAAFKNTPRAYVEMLDTGPLHPGPHTGLGRLVRTKQVIHITDVPPGRPTPNAIRCAWPPCKSSRHGRLWRFPMLKDDDLVGAIVIYRQEVRPFTDK
jgi:hypothetical protein